MVNMKPAIKNMCHTLKKMDKKYQYKSNTLHLITTKVLVFRHLCHQYKRAHLMKKTMERLLNHVKMKKRSK